MAIIAATRLRLRSYRFLPSLYWETNKIRRSLEKAPGFLWAKLLADRGRTFWTMSAWKDEDSMRAFRDSGVHAAAMPMVAQWCDEASVVHWETKNNYRPSWQEAHRRMTEAGVLSPLRYRSPDHRAHRFRKPHWTASGELVLEPRSSEHRPKAA